MDGESLKSATVEDLKSIVPQLGLFLKVKRILAATGLLVVHDLTVLNSSKHTEVAERDMTGDTVPHHHETLSSTPKKNYDPFVKEKAFRFKPSRMGRPTKPYEDALNDACYDLAIEVRFFTLLKMVEGLEKFRFQSSSKPVGWSLTSAFAPRLLINWVFICFSHHGFFHPSSCVKLQCLFYLF